MQKKMVGFLLSLLLIFIPLMSVNAAEDVSRSDSFSNDLMIQENVYSPLSLYVRNTYTGLDINSSNAICTASLTGYQGVTTKIEITMYLEKRFLFFWFTDTIWSATFYSNSALLNEQHGISSGTYRVKAVYVAYSGTASETITEYSETVAY
jgi:hypothetical protein